MKPHPAMWTGPDDLAGEPEVAREVVVNATLRLRCNAYRETVRTAEPGRMVRTERHAYRLAEPLPPWVEELTTSPVDYRGDARTEALEVWSGAMFATVSTRQNGAMPERRALGALDVWQRFLVFGAEFTPEQRRDFATHPLVGLTLREAAVLLARRYLDGFKSALDRGRWLHEVAQAGTVKGWTPEVLAAGPDGFAEALTAELDALPAHKAPALLERLGIPIS